MLERVTRKANLVLEALRVGQQRLISLNLGHSEEVTVKQRVSAEAVRHAVVNPVLLHCDLLAAVANADLGKAVKFVAVEESLNLVRNLCHVVTRKRERNELCTLE